MEKKPRKISTDAFSLLADSLDDIEKIRIQLDNRFGAFTKFTPDSDGEMRGQGFRFNNITGKMMLVDRLEDTIEVLQAQEELIIKTLNSAVKESPFGPWIGGQKGVGLKTVGRLLALTGDPTYRPPVVLDDGTLIPGGVRTVSQLWAYCGLGVKDGAAQKRRKGELANWNAKAKMRVWNIIDCCMKQLDKQCKTETGIADHVEGCGCSKYRIVIDERRKHTAITHPDWTPGHSLNDARRAAMKEFLKDLWLESKRLHDEEDEKWRAVEGTHMEYAQA